jgi:hypothetical protein
MRLSVRSDPSSAATRFPLALSALAVAGVAVLLSFAQSDRALGTLPTPTTPWGSCEWIDQIEDCFESSICTEVFSCVQCCNRMGGNSCQARSETPTRCFRGTGREVDPDPTLLRTRASVV